MEILAHAVATPAAATDEDRNGIAALWPDPFGPASIGPLEIRQSIADLLAVDGPLETSWTKPIKQH